LPGNHPNYFKRKNWDKINLAKIEILKERVLPTFGKIRDLEKPL